MKQEKKRVNLREANKRRIITSIIFLLFSVLIFYFYKEKNILMALISFSLFGLFLTAFNASLDDDSNYEKQTLIDFCIEYFYFLMISLLLAGIVFLVLTKFLDISDTMLIYFIGFTGLVYMELHIDFLKSNLLFFFRR